MLIPPMSSPVCMACVPASYVEIECKHLFESADVAAAGAQGCSCDSLVYVYLRREQDGVHCLSNLTKIKNNIGNVYSSHCVHIHHVYSSPCVHIHHVYSSTSFIQFSAKKNYLLENTKKSCFQADVDFNVLSLVVQYTEYQPSSILTENKFTQEKSLYSWL